MNTNEIVKALLCENQSSADCKLCEYCKIISESNVWHCDEIKIKQEAADTIERLQKELDAAKLEIPRDCITCANAKSNSGTGELCPYTLDCNQKEGDHWEWRGRESGDT